MKATLRGTSEFLSKVAGDLEALKPKYDGTLWTHGPHGDPFRLAARCVCRGMLEIHKQFDLGELRHSLRMCHTCASPVFFHGFFLWARERFGAHTNELPPPHEGDKWIWALRVAAKGLWEEAAKCQKADHVEARRAIEFRNFAKEFRQVESRLREDARLATDPRKLHSHILHQCAVAAQIYVAAHDVALTAHNEDVRILFATETASPGSHRIAGPAQTLDAPEKESERWIHTWGTIAT